MTTEKADTQSDQAATGQETAVDANTVAATGNGSEGANGPKFTQKEVDEIIKKRLDREKAKLSKKQEAFEKQQQEAQEAAADALSKSGEFEKLAQTRASQLAQVKQKVELAQNELEQSKTAVARYQEIIEKSVAAQMESITDPSLKLLLSKLDLVDQFDYFAAKAATVTEDKRGVFAIPATPKAAAPGIVTNGGAQAPQEQMAALKNRYRSRF